MARRANGEGSIFKRKDGTWSAELSYRDDYGTLKRRTAYGKTQVEVRTTFRDARERIEAGAPVKDASVCRCTGRTSTSTPGCCGSAGHCPEGPRDCRSTSPSRASPEGRCPSPARPSRRSGRTAADRRTSGARPPARGRTLAWSSPPRSGHRSSPATSCGASSCSPSALARPASTCTRSRTPRQASAGRRDTHQGRPRAPRSLVLRHNRRHLQSRRSRPAAGGGGPARPGAPMVSTAVAGARQRPSGHAVPAGNHRGGRVGGAIVVSFLPVVLRDWRGFFAPDRREGCA